MQIIFNIFINRKNDESIIQLLHMQLTLQQHSIAVEAFRELLGRLHFLINSIEQKAEKNLALASFIMATEVFQ